MKNSEHAFSCWIGTLPVLVLNFALNNMRGAWAVLALSVIILIIAIVFYVKEKREE